MFESKVAPANYKRPKALVTPAMIAQAMKTITEAGLESAMSRRFAKISDVTVNNVLWVNNDTKAKMKGGIEGLLLSAVKPTAYTGDPSEISIDEFMLSVLPTCSSIEMLVENKHLANFVSLTAPVDSNAARLFKWDNGFAWSYDGDVADSIKERVKTAGGNVTNAKLRISLAWHNADDLDLWVTPPDMNQIRFSNKRGILDVDMNAFGVHNDIAPVENCSWTQVQDGTYQVIVNQYNQRSTSNVGFTVEVESAGKVYQLHHPEALRGAFAVANIHVAGGLVTKIDPAKGISCADIPQTKWGLSTTTFAPVQTLMHSPNYWDDNAAGNRHYIFMLEGCKNPGTTRGIYNEFLRSDLEAHKRVMETLGSHTHCPIADDQLSGLGFSSTRKDSVVVKAAIGNKTKAFKINF